jgi:hypothetical protein
MSGAGIVNEGGPRDSTAFDELVAGSSPGVRRVALAVRDLVYDVLPQTVKVVWLRQGSVGWGTDPKKYTEQFAYLMPFKRHVTLGFYRGGGLDDPAELLGPGGTQVGGTLSMRSLKLASLDDVQRPELRDLIEASTRHVVPPPGNASDLTKANGRRRGTASYEFFLMCDELEELAARGVAVHEPISDEGWGLMTSFHPSGGSELGIYTAARGRPSAVRSRRRTQDGFARPAW